MDDEQIALPPPPMAADESDVLYLNNVKDKYDWNDQKVRREMKRVFPEVECRAKCIANGGIMFYDFKVERDVSLIENFDWGSEVEGALPFGGGCKTRRSKLTPVQVVNRSIRLIVQPRTV